MWTFIQGSGVFIWPLGLCSFLAVFIIVERLIALRTGRVIPHDLEEAFVEGRLPEHIEPDSVAGRILYYYQTRKPDEDQLKAYARLQIIRMERGLFVLDTVISGAPLLGLLGTVTGLVQVFGGGSLESGMPNSSTIASGIALALTTTILGLSIAIPSIVFSNYLNRVIDTHAARLNVGVERLLAPHRGKVE